MARTPRLTKIPVDERKLADLVKTKSDLSIRGQRDAWKKIVEEHEAPGIKKLLLFFFSNIKTDFL